MSTIAKKRIILIIGIVIDLGILAVYKYAGFVTGGRVDIALPVGISFFTFQMLSYYIDVYRDPEQVQRNPFCLLLYISLFPQLIAGPIVRYGDIKSYLTERHLQVSEIAEGISRFIIGLSKKLLIANPIADVVDTIYNHAAGGIPVWSAWLIAVGYTLQIYYDFSGYSDMAIGLGHMFGFTFKENFDKPYISTSMRSFWRRWHISLSSWFKEYLYIPLGGSRRGVIRAESNKLIVFTLTGLWHGAGWGFVLWGMIHGFAVVIEDLFRRLFGLKSKYSTGDRNSEDESSTAQDHNSEDSITFLGLIRGAFGWVLTMAVVVISFVWFRADTLDVGNTVVRNMFGVSPGELAADVWGQFFNPYYITIGVLALIGCLPFIRSRMFYKNKSFFGYIVVIFLYLLCMTAVAGGGYNPFIYFRF